MVMEEGERDSKPVTIGCSPDDWTLLRRANPSLR